MTGQAGGDPPMRVLYVARAPFISGAERALVSMLKGLDRDRVEPALVLGCETDLVGIAASINVPAWVIGLPKRGRGHLRGWWRSVRHLRRVMRTFEPDVVHANDVPSCQAMSVVAGRLGVPRVLHIRWAVSAVDAGWWARRGAEHVICISQWVRHELGDTTETPLAGAKVQVLPDAVDCPAQTHPRDGGASLDYQEPAVDGDREPGGGLRLGFAGQLIESKGLDLVIQAMGQVPPAHRPRLLVAGEDTQTGGAYKTRLQDLAVCCGVQDRITWLGFVKDISTLYSRVDAMVCPSRVEPLGLVPLEAARYKLTTIANRVGGLAETIEHGATGWLVDPTVGAWADVMGRVYPPADLARMGDAAWRRTRTLYSPEVYQTALMKVYSQLSDDQPRDT